MCFFYTLDNEFIEETDRIPADFTGIIEWSDGTKYWFLNGLFHRLDGPAIEYKNGYRKYCVNNKLHRLDGPAVEFADGTRKWFVNGELHRLDGPAVEFADGTKIWYLNGKQVTEEQHKLLVDIMKLKGLL